MGYFVCRIKYLCQTFFDFWLSFFGKENGDVPPQRHLSALPSLPFSALTAFDRIYPKDANTCIKAVNFAEHTPVEPVYLLV